MFFSFPNSVVGLKDLVQLYNSTAMTARCGVNVTGKKRSCCDVIASNVMGQCQQ